MSVLHRGGDVPVGSSTRAGDLGTAIVERGAETEVELVVMGCRGRGHIAGHLPRLGLRRGCCQAAPLGRTT